MAKNEFLVTSETDYEVIGIISAVKDFQLAFYINKHFNIDLCRKKDHKLEFKRGNSLEFPVFYHEEECSFVTLFDNKPCKKSRGSSSFLLNERKEFDFLLKIEGHLNDLTMDQILGEIKKISKIQFVQLIELGNIDSKENLIY